MSDSSQIPERQIRALYDAKTIRVYQAYNAQIADAALGAGKFVPPFSRTRMTWIKPSFLWMMYRAGWSLKDSGQARILAVDITREGFEWALRNASLTHGPELDRSKPVRVQWDPERDVNLGRLRHRAIQVGLGSAVVERYVDAWTVRIQDVTKLALEVEATRDLRLLPPERPYPVDEDLRRELRLG